MKRLPSGIAIVAALVIAAPVAAQRAGPGSGAETGTGPGVNPPGGPGPSLTDVENTGAPPSAVPTGGGSTFAICAGVRAGDASARGGGAGSDIVDAASA
jgi:hypothetical protein